MEKRNANITTSDSVLGGRPGAAGVARLVMLGLSALGMAMHFGMMSQMNRMMNGEASAAFLVLFLAWVLLVLAVVIGLVSRLVRTARS